MPFYRYCGADRPASFRLYQQASDPARRIDACCASLAPFSGADLLDVGAGNGFHALRFASTCRTVVAVEPDPAMRAQFAAAHAEAGSPANVTLFEGDAEALPLPEQSIDSVHARYAYFFGTNACLPGCAEVRRVLRPGGSFLVIDSSNQGEMGALYQRYFPDVFRSQEGMLRFWREQGFTHYLVETEWRTPDRATMAAAFALEHPPDQVAEIMSLVSGTSLTCATHVFHWRKS